MQVATRKTFPYVYFLLLLGTVISWLAYRRLTTSHVATFPPPLLPICSLNMTAYVITKHTWQPDIGVLWMF
jgi:hypothetical protein